MSVFKRLIDFFIVIGFEDIEDDACGMAFGYFRLFVTVKNCLTQKLDSLKKCNIASNTLPELK